MAYESWFDTSENRTLLAICARKLISNIGIGGTVWGAINIVLGISAMQEDMVNTGVLILGVMMLATGVQALRSPSLGILFAQTVVTVLLFLWNLGVSVLNMLAVGAFDPTSLIFPIIVAGVFANYYRKLQPVKHQVAAIHPEEIRTTKKVCKALVKKKLKEEPYIIQTTNRKCRGQLMDDKAFFIQRDLMRAFVVPRESVPSLIEKPDARSIKMLINHPLRKLRYSFDKKNSAKLKAWLSSSTVEPTAA